MLKKLLTKQVRKRCDNADESLESLNEILFFLKDGKKGTFQKM